MLKNLDELTLELKLLEKKYAHTIRKEINRIFELYPEIAGIAVLHWTPSYNDGDECVYKTHGIFTYPKNALNMINIEVMENYGIEYLGSIEEIVLRYPYALDDGLILSDELGPEFNEVERWIRKYWDSKMLIVTGGQQGITLITKTEWITEYFDHD